MVLFTGDNHLGHENSIPLCDRPFSTIEQMNSELICSWNERVTGNDTVYILGDMFFRCNYAEDILKQLHGKKNLIVGNHDKKLLKSPEVRALFMEIAHYVEIDCESKQLVLSHYPIVSFNGHFYNGIHLYGHVHNSFEWEYVERCKQIMIKELGKPCRMFNVGAMMKYMNYTPRTLNEILKQEQQ